MMFMSKGRLDKRYNKIIREKIERTESKREEYREERKNRKTFGVIIAVLLLAVFIGYFSLSGFLVASNEKLDNFAKCLTEKGAVMYGAFWCPHCENQKEVFGNSFQYVNYVECDPNGYNAQPWLCKEKQITGYPTWIINEQSFEGEQTLQKLSQLTNCEL